MQSSQNTLAEARRIVLHKVVAETCSVKVSFLISFQKAAVIVAVDLLFNNINVLDFRFGKRKNSRFLVSVSHFPFCNIFEVLSVRRFAVAFRRLHELFFIDPTIAESDLFEC